MRRELGQPEDPGAFFRANWVSVKRRREARENEKGSLWEEREIYFFHFTGIFGRRKKHRRVIPPIWGVLSATSQRPPRNRFPFVSTDRSIFDQVFLTGKGEEKMRATEEGKKGEMERQNDRNDDQTAVQGRRSQRLSRGAFSHRRTEECWVFKPIKVKCIATSNKCLTSSNKKNLIRIVICRLFVFPESIAKGSSGKSLEH